MADPRVGVIQARLQTSSQTFQKLETEMAGFIEARQRLDSQLSENELVLKEFQLLKPHNTVYKLVGPSLVPQDPSEARSNVEKRLEYIRSEMSRVEVQLKESEEAAGKKKEEIMALQQEFQSLQGPAAAAGTAGRSVEA